MTKPPSRYPDGDGLFFRTLGKGRAYFIFRYTAHGQGREMSLGPYPEVTLEEARIRRLRLAADVAEGKDPVGLKQKAKAADKAMRATKTSAPTFGQCAEAFLAANESEWRNRKHAAQWRMTLTQYAKPLHSTPVDQVDTTAIVKVLTPLWTAVPETASRLRARIEAVLAAAQVDGWIPEDRPNPARWKDWIERKLPKRKRLTRGHHKALGYADVPALMARLAATPGAAAKALMFTILTCARTGETLGATWDEVDLDKAVWTVPASRMKMAVEHSVPLSDAAVAILRAQEAERNDRNDHVFPGRPVRALSNMSMAMLLRRMGELATVHGFRSSARSWMADQGVAFELAEAALAHTVGNAVVQAYQRSSMLERRRPVLQAWANFVCPPAESNVVAMRKKARP